MSEFPDVLGMELNDAKALLEAEGLDFIVVETKPPKKELTEGVFRVIKAINNPLKKEDESQLILTVCRI